MSAPDTMCFVVAAQPTVRYTHVTLKTASKQNGAVQPVRRHVTYTSNCITDLRYV